MTSSKKEFYCVECGGTELQYDALASWDVKKQENVVDAILDTAYCNICDKEVTNTEAREIPGNPAVEKTLDERIEDMAKHTALGAYLTDYRLSYEEIIRAMKDDNSELLGEENEEGEQNVIIWERYETEHLPTLAEFIENEKNANVEFAKEILEEIKKEK